MTGYAVTLRLVRTSGKAPPGETTGENGQNLTVLNATVSTSSVTIASSGSTATVTETAHGRATGDSVTIAGANQGAYNGVKTITVVDANTYTFTVSGSPASPATGTIVASKTGYVTITLDMGFYRHAALITAVCGGVAGYRRITLPNSTEFNFAIRADN